MDDLRYRMDVNTLHRDEVAAELGLNEIGRVRIRTSTPLLLDKYELSRTTGGFILIDETTLDTVGAGMVVRAGPAQEVPEPEDASESAADDAAARPCRLKEVDPAMRCAPRTNRRTKLLSESMGPVG